MSDQPFPPTDPSAFLALCAGEWMSLRSSFELSSGGDDAWHSSERGSLDLRPLRIMAQASCRFRRPTGQQRLWPLLKTAG